MIFLYKQFNFFKRKIFRYWKIIVVFLLLFTWSKLHYPYSYNEAVFLSNFLSSVSNNVEKLNFGELMPAEWEVVCESNGYDEPLYLEKYKKEFPSVGGMQDGAWGLIFIKTDGSFYSVSSTCRSGAYIYFSRARCLPREKAVLIKEKEILKGKNCETFTSL